MVNFKDGIRLVTVGRKIKGARFTEEFAVLRRELVLLFARKPRISLSLQMSDKFPAAFHHSEIYVGQSDLAGNIGPDIVVWVSSDGQSIKFGALVFLE